MITSLVELLHLYLPGLIRSAELVGQRWSKTLTFHTPAEKHGALQIISVAGQDAPPHHCPIPANVKNDSSSETKNTKVLIASLSWILVSKVVSDRWRTSTATPVNISGGFTAAEFAATLQNTKLGVKLRDPTLNARS